MKNYELMYIVDPSIEDGGDAVKHKIEGIVTGREGIIQSFEKIGKKRLAYLIAKRQYGIYYLMIFNGNGKIVQALDNYLLMSSVVLRHIILAFSDKVLRLRKETDRIQQEEAERMRLGGKPIIVEGKEDTKKEAKSETESTASEKTKSEDSEVKTTEDKAKTDGEKSSTVEKESEKTVEPDKPDVKEDELKSSETQDPETIAAEESSTKNSPTDNGEKSKDQTVRMNNG